MSAASRGGAPLPSELSWDGAMRLLEALLDADSVKGSE